MSEVAIINDDKKFFSRIDKSVIDNNSAIFKSFGEDAGMVLDFIIFITKRLKMDMFGYTRFTAKDFANDTGRDRKELYDPHPDFDPKKNPKPKKPPVFGGHEFYTLLDYSLYLMVRNNIVFDKAYQYKLNGTAIQLKSFQVLKDVKVFKGQDNKTKYYDVRVSDELLTGFVQRYYNIEIEGYKIISRGRGSYPRKQVYIFLSKMKHILFSSRATNDPIYRTSVDFVAEIAGISVEENKMRKRAVKRILDKVCPELSASYKFVQSNESFKYSEDYCVSIDFGEYKMLEKQQYHSFFSKLLLEMKQLFNRIYPDIIINNEEDPFQRWLTNRTADMDAKIKLVMVTYKDAFSTNLTLTEARQMYLYGFINL